ncbi:MAG: DUF1566 domain-containing protein [Pseudomonadales bacterium]|nr:DUF1566 domain-containing protein [Pseudomonadales bacterium]
MLKISASLIGLTLAINVNAALYDRGNGLVYDDVLDITWLQDANLAASKHFGVANINSNGSMNLSVAEQWIEAMNTESYLNHSSWRMPDVSPINGISFDTRESNNGSTDNGYGGWSTFSEMGYMYYVNLGNLGLCEPNGSGSTASCDVQDGWGLNNTGIFSNIQPGSSEHYWTIDEFPFVGTYHVWGFDFYRGRQTGFTPGNDFFVWAVHNGDIGAVPIPAAAWLFASALLGLVALKHRHA